MRYRPILDPRDGGPFRSCWRTHITTKEARKIAESFDKNQNPSEDDIFMFTEAMNFLIEEEHDQGDIMYLGGYYYEIKRFDLALKYYEMAATYDYDPAYEGLAYIWYYGRTGERDFKKAFEYFSKLMDNGDPVSTYNNKFTLSGTILTACF